MAVGDCMLAANVLDHRFAGKALMPVELTRAKDYIKGLDSSVASALTLFLAKEPPYTADLFGEEYMETTPIAWWKAGIRLGFSSDLSAIAISLVCAVGSAGGIERQFSTLGMTYGNLRVNLGNEKAGKLAFLYRQLNKKCGFRQLN